VFQRGGRWWIAYYMRGREYRESAGTTEPEARTRLRIRLGEVARGGFQRQPAERLTVAELLDAYLINRQLAGKRGLRAMRHGVSRCRTYLGDWRAVDVTLPALERFVAARLAEGYAVGTVKQWLAYLSAAFTIGRRQNVTTLRPEFPSLRVDNARQGFFEPHEFEAVRRALPMPVDDIAAFAYHSGWRKGEILGLTWADVDRVNRVVRLPGARTKNGRPRLLPLVGELAVLMERRWQARKIGTYLVEHVFHRAGVPVKYFDKAWANACGAAGVGRRLFHDLRRTAVRDMVNAGVPKKVAKDTTGHVSDSVFDRYHIVAPADQIAALERTQAHRVMLLADRTRTETRTAKA
jgi:integrase